MSQPQTEIEQTEGAKETNPPAKSTTTTAVNSSQVVHKKDRFAFLGDARFATLLVSGITLLGILAFLAIPLQIDPTWFWVMKSYYTLSAGMIIFGYIAIIRYNPISITIYTIFYTVTALLSSFLSVNSAYEHYYTLKNLDSNCDPLVSTCPSPLKSALVLGIQAAQVLFWLISTFIIVRFYIRFRGKYLLWKKMYADQEFDGFFQHWCYRNHIDSTPRTNTNAALDSL